MNYKIMISAALLSAVVLVTACLPTTASPDPAQSVQTNIPAEVTSPAATPPPPESQPTADTQIGASPSAVLERVLASFTAEITASGSPLVVYGQVLDTNGNPQPGVQVEFWQTDSTGVYNHPNDPGTSTRDQDFQFFGTSTTDADGWYSFRTIEPAQYGSRPKHIHVKVKSSGQTLLTTQFYFVDDLAAAQADGIFRSLGDAGEKLLMELSEESMPNGEPVKVGSIKLVVDTGTGSGTMALTPSQAEGPYYPVVDFSTFDNDLASLR